MSKKTIVIKNVCHINYKTIRKFLQPEVIQYLDTSNITRNQIDNIQILNRNVTPFPSRAKRKVKNQTILYSTVRPIQEHFGFIVNPDNNLIVSTGFLTIDVKDDNVEAKFLYYALTQKNITAYLQTIAVNNASSYPSINPDDIGNLQFEIPSSKEDQQKIVAVISALDAKIELNNRINAQLEAIAKTLYDYWFVQFDFPNENGKPYKSSGGKMVYSPKLKREIPEGWEISVLSDWIATDKTGDWGKDVVTGNHSLEVRCIRGTDINGLNGIENLNAPTRYILQKNNHKLLAPFDFVVEISGGSPAQSTGRIAFITKKTLARFKVPLTCSNFCKAIALSDNDYFFNFAYLWSALYNNGVFFSWEGKTNGIKNLLFNSFINNYQVAKPPKEIAHNFYKLVEPMQEIRQHLLIENYELANLRDWLLPMLMNGQITIA
jgi:type I restriction enzyme S subunit